MGDTGISFQPFLKSGWSRELGIFRLRELFGDSIVTEPYTVNTGRFSIDAGGGEIFAIQSVKRVSS
jgi:hypothetical protein